MIVKIVSSGWKTASMRLNTSSDDLRAIQHFCLNDSVCDYRQIRRYGKEQGAAGTQAGSSDALEWLSDTSRDPSNIVQKQDVLFTSRDVS